MAWTEKRGKKYRGMFRDVTGRARSAGWSTSKREALGWAQDQERKVKHGDWFDPDAGKMLFSTYFEEHWIPNRIAELNTISGYQSHYRSELKDAFGALEVRKITAPVIQRWVVDMQKRGVSAGTARAKYRTLATVLGAKEGVSAVFDGLLPKTPCVGIALPPVDKREPDVYTVPEVDLLMTELGPWWAPIPLVAAETSFRWGELMGLDVNDWSNDFHTVKVARTIVELTKEETGTGTPWVLKPRPKGKKRRQVDVGDEVATLVRTMVKERQLFPNDRLFSMLDKKTGLPLRTPEWPAGRPIGRSYFREYVWKPAHERSGVTQRRFHDLRGSHISWLLAGGADIALVMERAGHEQLSTTQVYVDAMKGADQRALQALEALRKKQRNG